MDLRDTPVLVMGLGVHGGGLGVARWLLRQGARVTVTDMAPREALATPVAALEAAAAEAGATVSYTLGEHRPADFEGHPLVVSNPAVRPDSPWLARARAAGARIETEMTLFFRRCPGPIVGVTGTKGKTTTSTLAAAMLREAWPDTVLAGNMRVSALEALDAITPATPVVLELSSFQLVGLDEAGLSPAHACITNLSPDHLNYHGSMEAYARAKRAIFAHQGPGGVAVLPADQAAGGPLSPGAGYAGGLRTFGPGGDCRLDPDGVIRLGGEALLPADAIGLRGAHNLLNVLAAAALARSFGAPPAALARAAAAFQGVEHRQELVRLLDGVRFINDTTATNPAAAMAALASVEPPLVIIAGGADKGLPLDGLAAAIAGQAKAAVLLAGSATPALQATLAAAGASIPVLGPFDDLAAAVAAARGLAAPGDAVILSPGCASFGMFRNEFHRGEEFRRIVNQLEERPRPQP